MIKNFNYKNLIFLFFTLYFIVGILTFKDYGIGIEEHFQRLSGFYWLNRIIEEYNIFLFIAQEVNHRYLAIDQSQLYPIEFWNHYGVVFDLPAALIEVIFFNREDTHLFFKFRHLVNFFIFFISSIFFYKILQIRFKSKIFLVFGTLFYIVSPRIYGDSFHNNKDIVFLSFVTISIYFLFKFYLTQKNKNIILFAFFSSIAISTRLLGFFLPLSFIFFYFLELVNFKGKKPDVSYKNIFIYIFSLLLFYIIQTPLLWKNTISSLKFILYKNLNDDDVTQFFMGEYFQSSHLPDSYLPVWIIITNQLYFIIIFLLGYLFVFNRFYKRLFLLKERNYLNDLWRGSREKIDLFIFFNLTLFIILIISFNISMVNGWRYFYFFNIFLSYISIYGMYRFFKIIKNASLKKFIIAGISICIFQNILDLIKFHPHQSVYFNKIFYKQNYSGDFASNSSYNFFKIINETDMSNSINLAVASWTPLERNFDMLKVEQKKKYNLVGQNYIIADYIYTNYVYDVDVRYNNKYEIPENFYIFYTKEINNIKIFDIFKKK